MPPVWAAEGLQDVEVGGASGGNGSGKAGVQGRRRWKLRERAGRRRRCPRRQCP